MEPSNLLTSAAPAGFATRALLLLAAEGASVAFFLRTLRGARWLPAFIGRNEISPPGREQLATWVLGGAVVPVVVAALALGSAWRKGGRDAFAARAEGALQLARLLSVSLVLWAIPPMMSVAAWRDRDLAFLICAAALVVGFERALRCSLGSAEDLQLVRPLRDGVRAMHLARAERGRADRVKNKMENWHSKTPGATLVARPAPLWAEHGRTSDVSAAAARAEARGVHLTTRAPPGTLDGVRLVMRARRLLHALAVCMPLALIGSCGGATDSDEPSDGGHDSSPSDVAHEAAHDGEAGADAPITDSADADAANDGDAHCACPPTPPLDGGACCTPGGCSYCNAVKWEFISAGCKGGTWIINMQSDTPCGDN